MENADREHKPNIVIVMSDQHNAHVMGCNGNEIILTPNLDALVKGGCNLTSAYCPAPLCVPSRMGFMTGQYPGNVNIWDNSSRLSSDIPTFAHMLGASGYETVLCGRMHFKGNDQFHGFEKRIFGDCFNFISTEIRGSGYNKTTGQTKYAVEISGYGTNGYRAYDNMVMKEACDFIRNRKNGKRPYCLVVGFILPHNPLICSRELFDYYMEKITLPKAMSMDYLNTLNPALAKWRERRGVDGLTPEQNHRALASYYGLVTEMDSNIGKIMDVVKTNDDPNSTILIYCSDHGDMACEHGMWWKSNYFEGSARIPLVFYWPGFINSGWEIRNVISLIDVAPTVLDIAGADPIPYAEGKSFADILLNDESDAEWQNEIYCEYIGAHGDKPSCMIRSGAWKLMYYSEFDTHLLFNIEEDPNELHDLAGESQYTKLCNELLGKIMKRWSAEKMLTESQKEIEIRRALYNCGHPLIPYEVEHILPLESDNDFDFLQIPGYRRV